MCDLVICSNNGQDYAGPPFFCSNCRNSRLGCGFSLPTKRLTTWSPFRLEPLSYSNALLGGFEGHYLDPT